MKSNAPILTPFMLKDKETQALAQLIIELNGFVSIDQAEHITTLDKTT